LSKLNKIQGLTLGILSNGTLITDSIAYELKTSGVKFIQISIDGSEKMHDSLRGKGSWEKALKGIKTLRKVGIDVHISFTANQKNFKEYPEVVKLSNKLGVVKVWTDRVICNPEDDKSILGISKEQTIDYMRLVAAEHSKKNRTHASAGRALQFLLSDGEIYSCSASKNLLAILPGGNVLPCRRLPIEIGNIYKDSLWNILNQSEFSKKINSPYKIEGCRNCYYEKVCNGGLKCLSYAVYGNPFKKDPGCWQPDRKNQI
jgi:radical SAM protein with 4Fe4S-binding SPASM domain